jgi:hypothetical protein
MWHNIVLILIANRWLMNIALEINNLGKAFENKTELDNISF